MPRFRLTKSFVVLVMVMGAGFTALAQSKRQHYGVVLSTQFLNNDSEGPGLERTQQLGVGAVRVGMYWYVVEPTATGGFQWAWMDQHMQNAYNSQLEVFANLGEPPSWAAACEYCVPYSMDRWYAYVKAVMQRYAWMGSKITYGVWNEPDDNYFLRTSAGDDDHEPAPASRYVPLVQRAIQARNDSGTGAALALGDTTGAAIGNNWWYDFYYWQGVGSLMAPQDKIAVHWYPGTSDLTWYMQWFVTEFGREVWLTEAGPPGFAASDTAQVNNVNLIVDRFQSKPGSLAKWTRIFYYRLWDGQYNTEALLYPNWSQRPGATVYQSRIPGPVSLASGGVLNSNQQVKSPGGQFRLIYQSDGNLVLYGGSLAYWSSGTAPYSTGKAVMQTDGNLVVYDAGNVARFASNTSGNPGAHLSLDNIGRLRIYSTSGTVIWQKP